MKRIVLLMLFMFCSFSVVNSEWVNGYLRKDGTYVQGYYRTERDVYKWNNKSWDGDTTDIYNDKTYYKQHGYDPEPLDNDHVNTFQVSRDCLVCSGAGSVYCSLCSGYGAFVCYSCKGDGYKYSKCFGCGGTGATTTGNCLICSGGGYTAAKCYACLGTGQTKCLSCKGTGQRICYSCKGTGKQ